MIDWLWEGIAVAGGLMVLIIVITFFVLSAFTLWAAKIVKVENVTYGRALLATFLGSLAAAGVSFVLGLLLSPLFVVGTIFSTLGAWLIDSLVVKAIFRTTYGKSLLVTLLATVLAAVVGVVLTLLVIGGSLLSCVPY